MTNLPDKYYEDYFTMFATEGWKRFILDLEGGFNDLNDVTMLKSQEDFLVRKGELLAISRLLQFENGLRLSYDQMTEEREND